MDRAEFEILLAGVKRIEELEHYPVGVAGAWAEIRAHSDAIDRSGLLGQPADLARKVRYAIRHVMDSRPGANEDDERGRLRGYLWLLRVELEEGLKRA